MELKGIPQRLCDMCQKHAIYCTGSTSAPPGSVLKPDVSSNPFREVPGSPLEAHFCNSSTVLGSPLASILRSWSLHFSVHFFDAFLRRPSTSYTERWQAQGWPGWGGGFPIRDIPGADWSSSETIRQAAGLRPGAADLKAHSAGPATVPWGHSGTASENMLIVPVMIYEQVKLSPMVHKFILRVY